MFAGELILPKSIPPEIEEVEFDTEGDILFLESLLYDNSSPRPPEDLQANSNAIESLTHFSYPRSIPQDCPDYEGSRVLSFVYSIIRVSHPQLHFGNPVSKSNRTEVFIFWQTHTMA
ncbi:hypothetical protein Tco_0700229 [Tanacetum coccineum]